MRLIPVLLIALAVTFAGCAKKADDGAGTTTSTTTTPGGSSTTSSSSSTTSSTTTSSTPGTNTTTTPAPPPTELSFTDKPDWTAQGPPPAAPPAKSFSVPAGYTNVNLTVKWDCKGPPVCVTSGVTVKAAGLTCALPDQSQTPVPNCTKTGAAPIGDGKITYDGNGVVAAIVTLTFT